MAIKFIDFFLCLNSLNALTIEIWIVALSFVGLIISILGVIFIPWDVTSSVFQILFIIGLIFIALSMVVSLIIIYLRIHHNLKRRILRILILALLIVILICLISLIIFIIVAFGTISDLDNTITKTIEEVIEETGEVQNVITIEERMCSKTEKVITIIIIAALLVIWLILLIFWVSDYIRFIFNIDISYNEYVKNEKNKQLKHPIRYGYNVVGHDKYGFPILGKIHGNKIKIKESNNQFKVKDAPISDKYSGTLNVKYYAKYPQKPMTKEKQIEIINEKEKYLEKYFDGENIYQNYSNFVNNTILNFDDNNNSINPGYDM
jgi:hypothetical protein